MIILGVNNRYKTIGKGQFYCPHCQSMRLYERKKATRYFTLYFIPLIPMGEIGEIIECQTCRLAFNPDVLGFEAPRPRLSLVEMLNALESLLEDGMPVEYLIRDLTEAGLDRDVALKTIDSRIGTARKHCADCGLSYVPAVAVCAECHKPLGD